MITHQRLCEVLRYEPETGKFFWLITRRGLLKGREARGFRKGSGPYQRIRIDGVLFYGQRLAIFYVTKQWPAFTVDHINGDPSDNRWVNLRQATKAQNTYNSRGRSKTHLKGVHLTRNGKWRAVIQFERKQKHLGVFETEEIAHEAYTKAARELFGEFMRTAA